MSARRRVAAVMAASSLLGTSIAGVLSATPAAAVSTDQSYWVPATKKLVVTGHGYGHGHGMSQYGAQGAALKGLGYKEIVDFYYPGTTLGKMRGRVRVLISADTTPDVVVSAKPGLKLRDLSDRSEHELPDREGISKWRLRPGKGRTIVAFYNGRWRRYRADWAKSLTADAEFFGPGPTKLWLPSGSTRGYRGAIRAASPSPGSSTRDTVNVVTMDQYVMGVVPYEMPASWHPEAVKAQALAARTYATWSRSQNMRRHYQICDTTACQVYNGTDGEDPRSNAAVRATRREILRYAGRPAFTQFSASSGGWTSRGSVPYLPAQEDPYDGWDGNSVHSWTVTVDASRLERSHPGIGTLRRIRVVSRDGNGEWQGRVESLVLDGTSGNATISGDSFRWAFGLRSNWFSIKPTPIINRWSRIGAEKSVVGKVRSREVPVASGSAQRFQRGRIFYSKRTGPRELYGRVLSAYREFGGPTSKLGFPRSKVRKHGRPMRFARFENGGIYARRPHAATVLTGPIHDRYWAEGRWRSGLGRPVTSNYKVRGGQRVDFARGYIVWKRATGRTRLVLD